MVIKRDGRREPFSRSKVLEAVRRACVKRPFQDEELHALVERVAQKLIEEGATEISSRRIGELVLDELSGLDAVSFIRFTSVYREFDDMDDFVRLVRSLSKTAKKP